MNNLHFSFPGRFYKGNLQTHCTCSDGDYPVDEVVQRYREKGYDLLAMSDYFLECYDYPVTDTPLIVRKVSQLSLRPSCTPVSS